MNEREQEVLSLVIDELGRLGRQLIAAGRQPSILVLGPGEPDGEVERIPGYKVALVVPLDGIPDGRQEGETP